MSAVVFIALFYANNFNLIAFCVLHYSSYTTATLPSTSNQMYLCSHMMWSEFCASCPSPTVHLDLIGRFLEIKQLKRSELLCSTRNGAWTAEQQMLSGLSSCAWMRYSIILLGGWPWVAQMHGQCVGFSNSIMVEETHADWKDSSGNISCCTCATLSIFLYKSWWRMRQNETIYWQRSQWKNSTITLKFGWSLLHNIKTKSTWCHWHNSKKTCININGYFKKF